MLINNLQQTCHACPSSWEFQTDNNRGVYVRYRWGHLTVTVYPPNETDDNGICILSEQLGDSFDGVIDWETVESLLLPLDVEQEVNRTSATDALEELAFSTNADYRRKKWRERIEEMNNFIEQTNKSTEEMRLAGWKIAENPDPAKPFTEEQINEMLDKYETEYQSKIAKERAINGPKEL